VDPSGPRIVTSFPRVTLLNVNVTIWPATPSKTSRASLPPALTVTLPEPPIATESVSSMSETVREGGGTKK
jgi:hypothetical protein